MLKKFLRLTDQYAIYLAIGLSFIILFTPGSDKRVAIPGFDKIIHFETFGFLAMTAFWRFRLWAQIAVILVLYAVASEVIQHFWIPGREFDLLDILADCVGIATFLGLQVYRQVRREAR